jgi:NADH-quinone oxidoreductase subunit J
MDPKTGLFYFFSTVLLFAAFRVVTARNPVHAALYLVLSFFQASAIWMLLKAEFLSITLVLVYVGAVMVLFLFVVMMLDINIDTVRQGFWNHFPMAATIGGLVALEMGTVILGGFRVGEPITGAASATVTDNTRALGILLYTDYLYPVQIAALILLVAIIAAIALTLRSRKDTRQIATSEQIRTQASDRVQILKISPVRQKIIASPDVNANKTGIKP